MSSYSAGDFHLLTDHKSVELIATDPPAEASRSHRFGHATADYSVSRQMKHGGLSAAYWANENTYVRFMLLLNTMRDTSDPGGGCHTVTRASNAIKSSDFDFSLPSSDPAKLLEIRKFVRKFQLSEFNWLIFKLKKKTICLEL